MDQDTLWTDWENEDLDAHLKARVEELLADPQFLAWLDQQDAGLGWLHLRRQLLHDGCRPLLDQGPSDHPRQGRGRRVHLVRSLVR